jgi:hypothetical protein
MRVTIIADDAAVYVDGLALWPIDLTGLSSDIHAVQWYDTWGEIEYRSDANGQRPPNERIDDVTAFLPFVNRYNTAKAALPVPTPAVTSSSTGAVRVIAG